MRISPTRKPAEGRLNEMSEGRFEHQMNLVADDEAGLKAGKRRRTSGPYVNEKPLLQRAGCAWCGISGRALMERDTHQIRQRSHAANSTSS